MLAHVGGNNRAVVHAGGHSVDKTIVAQRIALGRDGARELFLQIGDQLTPVGTVGCVRLRDQLRQHFSHVALNGHVRLLNFTQLGAVDVHMDDFGVRAELLGFANRPVIKTRAHYNQQIRFLQDVVGAARAVHAQHAKRERVRFRQHAERHQGHGGGQAGFFSELADFIRGVNRPTAQIEHRAFGGINHRRGVTHALSTEFRRGGTVARLWQHVNLDLCGLDILRNVYPHRARAARLRNAKRIADNLRKLADIAN